MQGIALNCHQLQYLNLGWCDKVSDKGVKSLAKGCPDLRSLDLCGCVQITGKLVLKFDQSLFLFSFLILFFSLFGYKKVYPQQLN